MNTDAISGSTAAPKPATYSLYGLRVRSDLPLPLAHESNDGTDLTVRFAGLIPRSDSMPLFKEWRREGDQWLLRFQSRKGHVLEFRYDLGGKTITIRQSYPEPSNALFALMCPAMAAALHLQGRLALHATSLVHNGEAFLLMGSSGTGKSTLAAALASAGLSFHADDISALSWDNGRPVIQAGYPRLKVTPRVCEALGLPANALRPLFVAAPEYPETWVDCAVLPGGFHCGPAPLKAIYLLSDRKACLKTPRLETLSPGQAAMAMVRFLYGAPWLATPTASAMQFCARIAATTSVRRLWLPEGLENLRDSAHAITADMNF
ncbi:MAG: hypothetical protein NTX59_02360 [Elusimicrobia bacterium]|nr:hypothetical protein [Elusimicrobiota bacterium]